MTAITINDLGDLSEKLGMPKFVVTQLIYQTDRYYAEFTVSKKTGSRRRKITAPSRRLKGIQRWILDNILSKQRLSSACTAYKKNSSIIVNASPHTGQRFVMNADLSNFFPTISIQRVIGLFQFLGFDSKVAFGLAKLCCYNGHLPQGAPTSPMIANLICWRLDARLTEFARIKGWSYTRYSDDLTISGNASFDSHNSIFRKIVEEEGFRLNETKFRVMGQGSRQVVTGIVVNEKVNLSRNYKRSLRATIHQLSLNPSKFWSRKNELLGKLNYLEHVCGTSAATKQYRETLNSLLPD